MTTLKNYKIKIEREILDSVNQRNYSEELCGLSRESVKRWIEKNNLCQEDAIVKLVNRASTQFSAIINSYNIIIKDNSIITELTELANKIRE